MDHIIPHDHVTYRDVESSNDSSCALMYLDYLAQ